ncbi:nucleotide-diphospho-sugar transferase [Globomyces pollinis-pini]|nr:nucleotide-diphospho-sugar transferase [Globomyces pollinis-pini]
MPAYSFVTLLTNDKYLPGAIILAKSLKKSGTIYPTTVLATFSNLSDKAVNVLQHTFDHVINVDLLLSNDPSNLALLGRPELDVTFTKLHTFNPKLLPFDRVCFMDADTMIVQNIDDIFEFVDRPSVEFAAAPDIGWPDCFNSGVFVTKPSQKTFEELISVANSEGSFDGGDQGLLNTYFSTWSNEPSDLPRTARIPFLYNVTPSTFYSYLPAFKKFHDSLKVIHFIGNSKPWKWSRTRDGSVIPCGDASEQTVSLVQKWWSYFDEFEVHQLIHGMILDRDWGRYIPPMETLDSKPTEGGAHYHIGENFKTYESTSKDFKSYTVQWRDDELGPFRSKSPTKLVFDIKPQVKQPKKELSPNGIEFSTTSPTKVSPTKVPSKAMSNPKVKVSAEVLKETKPHVPPAVTNNQTTEIGTIDLMYKPGSVYTLNEFKPAVTTDLDSYTVEWNNEELHHGISSVTSPSTRLRSPSEAGKVITTPNFSISTEGVITYHN